MPDVVERRKLVAVCRGRAISTPRACELLGVSRRRLQYASRKNDGELAGRLMELAREHPRFGARRLCVMLRREGRRMNLKRVRRLCRGHGLLLKPRRRRKRRGIGAGLPCRAEHPGHVWAYDFVEDRTETGRKLRILTVVDEFTRRELTLEVEHRMSARFVAGTLLKLFERHGTPAFIRSDNGPEFIAKHLMRVMRIHGVSARHIEPGSPWQNGIDERFNGTLRDECLNMETFDNRDHARVVIRLFGRFYNERRPHSGLAYLTPDEFYERWKKERAGGANPGLRPGPQDLSLCGPPAGGDDEGGPGDESARPASRRMAIHDGAQVASQRCPILRVDARSVAETKVARDVPRPGTANTGLTS
jgi:putative transposase